MLDDNFDITEELFALIAAINPYAGRNSKLARSLRARAQLRDDEGRWIFMGGGSRASIRLPNNSIVSTVGRSAGASSQPGMLQMYIGPGSPDVPEGFYLIDSTKTHNALAILPGAVPTAPYQGSPTDGSIVNLSDLTRLDAPEGWTKNEDGSYTSDDGEFTIKPDGNGNFDLFQGDRRVAKGLDNPASALSRAAKIDIQGTLDADTKKVVARLKKNVTAAKNLNKDNVLELDQDEIDARIKDAEDQVERALFNDPEIVGEKDAKQEALNRNLQDLLSDAKSLNAELEKIVADYDALENKRNANAQAMRRRRDEIKQELLDNAEDTKTVQDELDIQPDDSTPEATLPEFGEPVRVTKELDALPIGSVVSETRVKNGEPISEPTLLTKNESGTWVSEKGRDAGVPWKFTLPGQRMGADGEDSRIDVVSIPDDAPDDTTPADTTPEDSTKEAPQDADKARLAEIDARLKEIDARLAEIKAAPGGDSDLPPAGNKKSMAELDARMEERNNLREERNRLYSELNRLRELKPIKPRDTADPIRVPTAEELNRKDLSEESNPPGDGPEPTPEDMAVEWKPTNEPTRYFINGQELDEAGLEEWINNAEQNDIIYAQTQRDGKPFLEKYIKNANGFWYTFSGKLDNLDFDNEGMAGFIRGMQDQGTIVTNNRPENLDAFPEDVKAALDRVGSELTRRYTPQRAPRRAPRRSAYDDLNLALDGTPLVDLPPVQFDSTVGPDASWVRPDESVAKFWKGDVVFVDGEWKRVADRKVDLSLVSSSDPNKEPYSVRKYTYTFEDGTTLEATTVNGWLRDKKKHGKGYPVAHIDPRRRPEGANREQVLPEGAAQPAAPAAPAAPADAVIPVVSDTPSDSLLETELHRSPVGSTIDTADGGWTKIGDDLWASDDTGEVLSSDDMFIRSMGNYDFGPTENITPDSPVSAKAAEFKSRMDEQKKAVADKYSESTGGLDISSEINPLIDEPLDFNDPEEVNAYLRDLNERIDEAKDRIEVLYDDEEANQEEITALEEQVDELTIERDNVQNAFTSRNASKKRAEEAAAKASEGPKTKQEADELIASTERRLARAENSPDSTEERIAQIQETLDNLRALRDTLPETKEKEGEKDGGDTGDRGTDSGRKGKVSGKVERPAPTAKLDRRGNSLWDRNRNVVVGTAVSEAPTADSHRALGRHVPKLFEVPQTEAEFFRNRLIEAAASNKHGSSVTIKPLSEYQKPGVRMFITQDGGGGVALDGDDIVTGFMHSGAADKGNGSIISMVDKMVELGGRRLDAFDTILPKFYAEAGFRAVARLKFNPEFAPTVAGGAAKDWNEADYENFNNGQPDVVFMVFDPNHPLGEYSTEDGEYVDDYELGNEKQAESLAAISTDTTSETDRKEAAANSRNQERQRIIDALDEIRGSDGLFEGDVPKAANGNPSAAALREAQIGQVIEYKFANGVKARFIKMSRDIWRRADKPDDRKNYRSADFTRDKTLKFVTRTENDFPSFDNSADVNQYRPDAYRFNRKATDAELERLVEIYQRQVDEDSTFNGRIRANETVRVLNNLLAVRRGERPQRRQDPFSRESKELRDRLRRESGTTSTGRADSTGQTQRKSVAKTLVELGVANENPEWMPNYNVDAYVPTSPRDENDNEQRDLPNGWDDPSYLATRLNKKGLSRAFINSLVSGAYSISVDVDGTIVALPIEAARDTLQRMGSDTNFFVQLAEVRRLQAAPDTQAGRTSGPTGMITSEPETWSEDLEIDRITKFANMHRRLKGDVVRLARLYAQERTPSNTKAIADLKEHIRGLKGRILREQALGLRLVYQLDDSDDKILDWNSNEGDIVDPRLIMGALKSRYPNAEVMPNGDLKISDVTRSDENGNMFRYELFITETDDNTFYPVLRETNFAEPDETKKYRSARVGRMSQSARTVAKQVNRMLAKMGTTSEENTDRRGDVHTWFKNKNRMNREYGFQIKTDALDENGSPIHQKDQLLTRAAVERIRASLNMPELNRETIQEVFNLMLSQRRVNDEGDRGDNAVLLYIQSSLGFSQEQVNTLVDGINEGIHQRNQIQRYTLWHDASETPIMDGDIVQYVGGADQRGNYTRGGTLTDDLGEGVRAVVRQRLFEFTATGSTGERYTYTDYVHIDLIDENGNVLPGSEVRVVSANNLKLLETAGGTDGLERTGPNAISLPMPRLTTRGYNRYASQNRLDNIAPFMSEYTSLASPKVRIDGVDYKVQASRARVLSDNLDRKDIAMSEVQVGDFLVQTDPDTKGVRLAEVVGVEVNENGGLKVTTVVPRDLGSADVSQTVFPDGMDPVVAVYRENVQTTVPGGDANYELENPVTTQQRDTIAAAVRTIDTSRLPEDTLNMIRQILGAPDLEDLGLTGSDVVSILREIIGLQSRETRDGTILGETNIEDTITAIDIALNAGSPDPTTRNNLERVRRAALARGWELGNTEAVARVLNRARAYSGMGRSNKPAQFDSLDRPYEDTFKGPYKESDGASSMSIPELKDALQRRDRGAVQEMLYNSIGNRVFGTRHRLANIQITSIGGSQFSYSAQIVDADGTKVGSTTREINIGGAIPEVYHATLFIDSQSARRSGFAKSFKLVSDGLYKSLGIKQIRVSTASDGVVVWAKMNYTWQRNGDAQRVKDKLKTLREQYARRGKPQADLDIMDNMISRLELPFRDENFPDPIDIGYMVDSSGVELAPLLLSGWSGVRYLDSSVDPRPKNRQDKKPEDYKKEDGSIKDAVVTPNSAGDFFESADDLFVQEDIQRIVDSFSNRPNDYEGSRSITLESPFGGREGVEVDFMSSPDDTELEDLANEFAETMAAQGYIVEFIGDVDENHWKVAVFGRRTDSPPDDDGPDSGINPLRDDEITAEYNELLRRENEELEKLKGTINRDELITDPQYFLNGDAKDGDVVKLYLPTSTTVFVLKDGEWYVDTFNSANTDVVEDYISPERMASTFNVEGREQFFFRKITDQAEVDKVNKFVSGEIDVVEPTAENFATAVANRDGYALSSMLFHTLYGGGDKRYGDLTLMNFQPRFSESDGGAKLFFNGDIYNDRGEKVGTAERTLVIDSDGSASVYHNLMEIDEENRGTGFSTEFSAAAEELYKKLGIDAIRLQASWDGSYVWAKAGYQWDTEKGNKGVVLGSIRSQIRSAIETARNDGRLRDSDNLQDLLDRLTDLDMEDPNFPTPLEIASLKSEDPDRPNFAYDFMYNTDWRGIKRLNGGNVGEYGQTGDEIADEINALMDSSQTPGSASSGETPEESPVEFDGWQYVGTKEYAENQAAIAASVAVRRAKLDRAARGKETPFTPEAIKEAWDNWKSSYEGQFKDSYIYTDGVNTLEIQKAQIDSLEVDDAVAAINRLTSTFPVSDNRRRTFRLIGDDSSKANLGAHVASFSLGEETTVMYINMDKVRNMSESGAKKMAPAATELQSAGQIIDYVIAHEYGHLLDFSYLGEEGERAGIAPEDRSMSFLSTAFREYIMRVAPELWSSISEYANGYGDTAPESGIANANIRNLEVFAEAFAQMVSERFYGASETEIGAVVFNFLREMGLV